MSSSPTPSTSANTKPPPNLSNVLPKLTPRRRRPPPAATNPQPIPTTPPLPAPLFSSATSEEIKQHTFIQPKPRIISPKDLELFLTSPTYELLLSFVFTLTDSVKDTAVSKVPLPSEQSQDAAATKQDGKNGDGHDDVDKENDPQMHEKTNGGKMSKIDNSEKRIPLKDGDGDGNIITKILTVLDKVEAIIHCNPADNATGSRFGNIAFRTFLDQLDEEVGSWHRDVLGVPDQAVDEVKTYFAQSWGNRRRIDYGSGHELNFVVWLLCLYQLSLITISDFPALILHIFTRYLSLTRLLQSTYYLEPAGSHGVWGLDDYVFLPFLFGSSQLLHHPFIRPLSIHNSLILEEYAHEYLYLSQVAFVNSIKNVEGLRWHSPMLDDISSAKNWEKIEHGMRRMFVVEVLGKLPVMQHFVFGSLVKPVEGMSEERWGDETEGKEGEGKGEVVEHKHGEGVDGKKHNHDGKGWGDCCGIKVPSSVAAAEEMKKKKGGTLRRIPFD